MTASDNTPSINLGRTQGQRAAEIAAGLRAVLNQTPEAQALTSEQGREITQSILDLEQTPLLVNFVAARTAGFRILTERAIAGKAHARIVEIASGYSPRGIQLAQTFPQHEVIEVDLPDVVEEKQRRLRAANIAIPSNLRWYTADLSVTPLRDVLEGETADVVSAEGLHPYFPSEENVKIFQYIRPSITPGGAYIVDMAWNEIFREDAQESMDFINRQAGKFLGTVEDAQTAIDLFEQAGFTDVSYYRQSELTADMLEIPKPVIDIEILIVAHNPTE